LLDKLSGERDTDGDSIRIIHARDGSLDNSAEMKREPIGRLGGPHATAARVEVVTKVTKLGSNRFCDENFVQTARAISHSWPIRLIAMSRMSLVGSPNSISRKSPPAPESSGSP